MVHLQIYSLYPSYPGIYHIGCWYHHHNNVVVVEVLLYVHRNHWLTRDGSSGRPPRLSHNSWAYNDNNDDTFTYIYIAYMGVDITIIITYGVDITIIIMVHLHIVYMGVHRRRRRRLWRVSFPLSYQRAMWVKWVCSRWLLILVCLALELGLLLTASRY